MFFNLLFIFGEAGSYTIVQATLALCKPTGLELNTVILPELLSATPYSA